MKFHRLLPALYILLLMASSAWAQEDTPVSARINATPSTLLFRPLIAHHIEARIGAQKSFEENAFRLDIGNSVDLLYFQLEEGAEHGLALGLDFFTWTALRRDANFHFPVDAVDYLFGGNASYRHRIDKDHVLLGRFRFSHISAHLVDGNFNKADSSWRNGQLPRVYSREFLDVVGAWEQGDWLRTYAGVTYVYHIDPADLGKFGLQGGIECAATGLWQPWINVYAAYDFRLFSITAYTGNHSLQAGVKFGSWRGKGLQTFVTWYDGYSQHGEYHDGRLSYWGWGMSVDF